MLPSVDYSGTAHLLKLKPGMLTNPMKPGGDHGFVCVCICPHLILHATGPISPSPAHIYDCMQTRLTPRICRDSHFYFSGS